MVPANANLGDSITHHLVTMYTNILHFSPNLLLLLHPRRQLFRIRSGLPFLSQKAAYYRELEAAVEVVEKACRICVHVQRTLSSKEGRIVEKNDQSPVTIADFGVQALISLELGRQFPSILLVAEEDSGYLRENNLVGAVVNVIAGEAINGGKPLVESDVVEAIDRGGKKAVVNGDKPASYWVLDPIDGTRGFVEGTLYVVGLSLVVNGEIVLGVIGCPKWQRCAPLDPSADVSSGQGIVMAAHVGFGTWSKGLFTNLDRSTELSDRWTRCSVDGSRSVSESSFCTSDNQTWDSLPLSALYGASTNADEIGEKEILLLRVCCGSLSKYMMVALGRLSVYIQRSRPNKIIQTWDHASGQICVVEAGGKVSDWQGEDLDFAEDSVERRIMYPTGGILVTSGIVHDQILGIVSDTPAIV